MQSDKCVVVTGGTGFIGRHLCRFLSARGYRVHILSRQPADALASTPSDGFVYFSDFDELDLNLRWFGVVNLAGESLNSGRWNATRKALFRDSRVEITQRINRWIAMLDHPPAVYISGSAIGWYGHCGNEIRDEASSFNDGFSHQLCEDWENAAREGLPDTCRGYIVRIGIVLGVEGGPLPSMLPTARLGLGGAMGTGDQWWSWIHIHDLVRLVSFLLENEEPGGVYNGTAPNPVTQRHFASCLGKTLRRPAFFPLPAFAARLMLGEFAEEVLLKGQRVMPKAIRETDFEFQFPELPAALEDLLGRL
jgi:uncharacterized protein (TIGR01777 family)